MDNTFWAKYRNSRATRRNALRVTAGAGLTLGALSLLGCSDDGDDGSGSSGGDTGSGLLSRPVETTSEGKKGGEWHGVHTADVSSFDAATGTAIDVQHAMRSYSRIVKHKAIKFPEPITAQIAPDAAASWEISPDGLTYTYKIRPNMKFDPRPPTNGRVMTANDLKFSIDRFLKSSRNRGDLSNAVNPNSPVLSAEAPDSNTLKVSLAFPYAPFNYMLANFRYIGVMPVEVDDGYDVRQTMRGTGAWRITEDKRGVETVYEKNPDWYDADKVFLDKMYWHVIPEASTSIAQFRAGAIWYDPAIPQDQILDIKRSSPDLQLLAQEVFSTGSQWLRFGYLPGSVFLDERVRKAVSVLLDRDLYNATFGNVEAFEAAGLEVPSRWHSSFTSGWDAWRDPKDEKAFGEAAKWFKHDPAEAKKLLAAAGHTKPLEVPLSYPVAHYGPDFDRRLEVMRGMLEGSGDFKFTPNTMTYSGVFSEKYTNGNGQWDGLASANTAARAEIDIFVHEWFHSVSQRSDFLKPDGSIDTELDSLLAKQRAEVDPSRRTGLLVEIQKYLASKMYLIWEPGETLGFTLAQPWIGNWGVYRQPEGSAPEQEGWIYHWDKRLS